MSDSNPILVSILMGSTSDAEVLASCRKSLDRLKISHEAKVLSAHRTPHELVAYLDSLEARGCQIIVAAAGMAAHLGGVVAAHTRLPVLGVPIPSGTLGGMDALLAISQMPGGVPVATLGIGSAGGKNAAYMAARILALHNPEIKAQMEAVLEEDRAKVLNAKLPEEY
ncbi:MAG: 5-(carboxyamino)imidazole ribonucleotide mutase [Myxococcota bacterium]|nr:5-(carboxyamino)imidazole ribonucleotide mutase [Myxococcota bacterium]